MLPSCQAERVEQPPIGAIVVDAGDHRDDGPHAACALRTRGGTAGAVRRGRRRSGRLRHLTGPNLPDQCIHVPFQWLARQALQVSVAFEQPNQIVVVRRRVPKPRASALILPIEGAYGSTQNSPRVLVILGAHATSSEAADIPVGLPIEFQPLAGGDEPPSYLRQSIVAKATQPCTLLVACRECAELGDPAVEALRNAVGLTGGEESHDVFGDRWVLHCVKPARCVPPFALTTATSENMGVTSARFSIGVAVSQSP